MNSTKLLLITSEFPPQPGGIGNHAFHLAKQLQQLGWQVEVLTEFRSEHRQEELAFDREQTFSIKRVPRRRWMLLSYFQRIGTALSLAIHSDLVMASGKFSLWTAGLLQFLMQRTFVAVIHGSELKHRQKWLQRYTDYCLQKMDLVIGVSHFTLSLVDSLQLKNTLVINNGFEAPHVSKKTDTLKDRVQLITVGNLTQRKGQHNVIHALPALKEVYPNLVYHMVGIPTDQERLESLSASLGVSDEVVFHGRVSETEKLQLVSQSDCFVMLSENTPTGDVEGFGIAILEANALGVPALGSLGCGIEDAIQQGYSGQLVDPHDPKAIVSALQTILTGQDAYRRQAQQWAQGFAWENVGVQYHQVLLNALESNT